MNAPRHEYPRPMLVRDAWQNLSEEWDFCFDFGAPWKYIKSRKSESSPFDRRERFNAERILKTVWRKAAIEDL